MLGCAGVHVERTQTAQGSGFDLVCARGDQCEHKAEKLCRQGYRVIARSEPNDNPDGRHHWSIVCGDSEQGADLAATPTKQETTTGSPNVTGAQGESAAAESPSASAGPRTPAQMTLDQAKAASVKLEPGMTRQGVVDIFGMPKKTAAQPINGASEGTSSNGLMWTYEWWIDHPARCKAGAFCRGHASKFELVFARNAEASGDDAWVLSSWSWSGDE
jgi:hypothetical protein